MDTLVAVEILTRRDHVHARQKILLSDDKSTLSIGRDVSCDVIVDDPYVAPLHVTIARSADGQLLLTDAASVNGVWLGGNRVRGARDIILAGRDFRIGHTRIRIRMPGEQLAPERADGAAAKESNLPYGKFAALGLIVCLALLVFSTWLSAPRDIGAAVATAILGLVVTVGLWIGIWALLSRIMMLEWRWLAHTAILLCAGAAIMIADSLFEIIVFALDLHIPRWLTIALGAIALGGVLYLHLRKASPMSRRLAAALAFVLPVAGLSTTTWVEMRDQRRNVNYIEGSREIYPPYLRVRAATPVDTFLESASKIKIGADEKRSIAISEGEDELDYAAD